MTLYNIVSATFAVAVAGTILVLIRRDRLHTRYAIWWVPIAFGIVVLGFFPGLNDRLSLALGITYPPVLPITIGLVLLVVKILMMDIERSRNEQKLHRLAQRLAILESELLESGQRDERGA